MATETTKLAFVEGAAASTPAASRAVIYAKADGLMYSKDDAGAETLMSSGSVGSVATDPIWDAAGDLVQGTGANTAAKLSAGVAGQLLKSAGAAAANTWGYPTASTAKVATSQTTTSGSFADLATAGPSVTATVGASGKVKLSVSSRHSHSAGNVESYIGVDISGASTVAATTIWIGSPSAAGLSIEYGRSTVVTGLTPGSTTFKMQYATGSGTATFLVRELIVELVD